MSQRLYILTASLLIPPYCSWDEIFSVFLCDMQLLIHPYKPKKKIISSICTRDAHCVCSYIALNSLYFQWIFLHNKTSKACPTRKQYEMKDVNVVCCSEFFCHSEMKLFEPQWHYRSKKVSSKRKHELLYIDLSGVINGMLKV